MLLERDLRVSWYTVATCLVDDGYPFIPWLLEDVDFSNFSKQLLEEKIRVTGGEDGCVMEHERTFLESGQYVTRV